MIQAIAILILYVGFLSNTAQSIRFDLQSGHTKCIAEDIKSNSMTVGKYSIVNPNEGSPLPDSHKVTVRVRNQEISHLGFVNPKIFCIDFLTICGFWTVVLIGELQVSSSYGNNYHYSDLVGSGQFAFTAAEAGDYMACFWAPDHKPQATITVDFDWKTGVAAKDWSNVAKKGSIDVSEVA